MAQGIFAALKTYQFKLRGTRGATETRTRSSQSLLKLIELSIRLAFVNGDLDFDQRLIWNIATVIDMFNTDLSTDATSAQLPIRSNRRNTRTGWTSAQQPRPFIIREEEHPLKPGTSTFRAYTEDMQPVSIEGKSVGEAETDLRSLRRVSSITVLYLEHLHEVTPSGSSTQLVPHDCMGECCPCQYLLPDRYDICVSHGYYACMKRIDDDWLFFPADGTTFVANWNDAKWYRDHRDALDFIHQYIANEEAGIEA